MVMKFWIAFLCLSHLLNGCNASKVVRYFHSFQLEVRRHIWLLLDCRLGVFVGVCNVGEVWGVFSASVGRTLAHTSTK